MKVRHERGRQLLQRNVHEAGEGHGRGLQRGEGNSGGRGDAHKGASPLRAPCLVVLGGVGLVGLNVDPYRRPGGALAKAVEGVEGACTEAATEESPHRPRQAVDHPAAVLHDEAQALAVRHGAVHGVHVAAAGAPMGGGVVGAVGAAMGTTGAAHRNSLASARA